MKSGIADDGGLPMGGSIQSRSKSKSGLLPTKRSSKTIAQTSPVKSPQRVGKQRVGVKPGGKSATKSV